ncbi:hypothetical protein HOY82DRAFT_551658 [Tuber indicum]|nr:hypothetical protein HOY82DRAFT_551658 [Tuber indicum]
MLCRVFHRYIALRSVVPFPCGLVVTPLTPRYFPSRAIMNIESCIPEASWRLILGLYTIDGPLILVASFTLTFLSFPLLPALFLVPLLTLALKYSR